MGLLQPPICPAGPPCLRLSTIRRPARRERLLPSAAMDRIECQWCKSQNDAGQTTCATCGAPLDARNLVSDSGWKEAPRLRDMTEFKFSNSTCQVEGELVPVAELNLGEGDWVFFEHHVLLWKDERHAALGAADVGRAQADARRHADGDLRGPRSRSGGLQPGRIRRGGGPPAAPEHGDRRARARLPGRFALAHLLLRAPQGHDQHAARRGHVHGPLRHLRRTGDPPAPRLRQRVRAHPGSRGRRSWWSRGASSTRTRRSR